MEPLNIYTYSICYLLVFLFTGFAKQQLSNRFFDQTGKLAKNKLLAISLQFIGIIFFGLAPILMVREATVLQIPFQVTTNGYLWCALAVAILLISLSAYHAGTPIKLKAQQVNAISVSYGYSYFLFRVVFLCAYELFFRGFLLFDLQVSMGSIAAISISTLLTVAIHVFNNKKEMLACIPFGIVLSLLCLGFRAVWPAMILHASLSLWYEIPVALQFSKPQKSIV